MIDPRIAVIALLVGLLGPALECRAVPPATDSRFEVRLAAGLDLAPVTGRLLVVLDPQGRIGREPRHAVGQLGKDAPIILGRDVEGLRPGEPASLDEGSACFPIECLDQLPAGEYKAQAMLHRNPDLRFVNAPGDLYGEPVRVWLAPGQRKIVSLALNRRLPDERLPRDTEFVRHLKIQSRLLSDFHGRPIFLRASVILPRGFAEEPQRRYPLRVHVGGFGSRFTDLPAIDVEGSLFRRFWLADDTPRFLYLKLDGAGPLGDPYQVNSANHGPYGDAITSELIPLVESRFRGIGEGRARVLDGGSTGGWVALALQIFYPDQFNGAWAMSPDPLDFRSLELLNIYEDANAYTDARGVERPAAREVNGDVRFTTRRECQLENVLGEDDSWANSGGQWGSWNATFGPRGSDGRPVPLWDPRSGRIRREVAEQWKARDLRLVLQRDWPALGPRLRGKLHVWVGEADDYFLNHAVHRFADFLQAAEPPFEGTIVFGPGRGHVWSGISESEMMDRMAAATGARP